ncbi:hypothetical protein ABZP36_000355 [Zizania latifolia]
MIRASFALAYSRIFSSWCGWETGFVRREHGEWGGGDGGGDDVTTAELETELRCLVVDGRDIGISFDDFLCYLRSVL